MADPITKEILGSAIGNAAIEGLKALLVKFGEKFGEHSAEHIGKHAAEWVTFQLFGVKSEDERRYNEARQTLPETERIRLNQRLAQPNIDSDWYRICVMNNETAAITRTLLMHAQMEDPEWANEVAAMNLEKKEAEHYFRDFGVWAKGRATSANATFATHPIRDRIRGFRERMADRARDDGWT